MLGLLPTWTADLPRCKGTGDLGQASLPSTGPAPSSKLSLKLVTPEVQQLLAPQAVVPVPWLLAALAVTGAGDTPGAQEGLLGKQGCCWARGHHKCPTSSLSWSYKKAERCLGQQSQQDTGGHPAPGTTPRSRPVARLKSLGRDKL